MLSVSKKTDARIDNVKRSKNIRNKEKKIIKKKIIFSLNFSCKNGYSIELIIEVLIILF